MGLCVESHQPPSSSALAPILAHLRGEPSRTWSIIITVFGDALMPRGGAVLARNASDVLPFAGHRRRGRAHGHVAADHRRLGRAQPRRTQQFLSSGRTGAAIFPRRRRTHLCPAGARLGRAFRSLLASRARRGARARGDQGGATGLAGAGHMDRAGGRRAVRRRGPPALRDAGEQSENRAVAARAWPLAETGEAYRRSCRFPRRCRRRSTRAWSFPTSKPLPRESC